jgi:hypothetical protein
MVGFPYLFDWHDILSREIRPNPNRKKEKKRIYPNDRIA